MDSRASSRRRVALLVLLSAVVAGLLVAAGSSGRARAASPGYVVTSLVSDGFLPARHADSHLVNGWGISAGPGTPWWVSDNGADRSTLYGDDGAAVPLVVRVEGGPTGTVFNGGSQFRVSDGAGHVEPALFLFASENGTIHGWNPAVPPPPLSEHAFVVVNRRAEGAVFKGLAIAGDRLYATDFHNGRVDVFNGSFGPVNTAGAFTDPSLPAGFAPFGIQSLGGHIFVTYAKQDADRHDEIDGPGLGFVDMYDTSGHLLARVGSAGDLNAPWGLAWAPHDFGTFSGDLLVGNFGDGRINAFQQGADGRFTFAGQLRTPDGKPLTIDGLWGIGFGNGAAAGPTNALYFAAGPDHEEHGLFGRIDPAG